MTCEGCGAEIPKEHLQLYVDLVLQRGGRLETLTFWACVSCTDKEGVMATWSEPEKR